MNHITVLEENVRKEHQKDWYAFLSVQKFLVERYFDWLKLYIDSSSKSLLGRGFLRIGSKRYGILLSYSPYHPFRYDRIYIEDDLITYNRSIHLYDDLSLCLYHPTLDQGLFQKIPLYKMIPWITEWIIFYEQWKKYGVWLGDEIRH